MKRNIFKTEIGMLSKELSNNRKSLASFAIAASIMLGAGSIVVSQTSVDDTLAASEQTENTTFQVEIQDMLSVSVTTPQSGATGNVDDFLRNKVDIDVASNDSIGFTASMYSSADNTSATKTDLSHETLGSEYTISTLSSGTQRSSSNFVDHWGYSLKTSPDSTTYGETDAGNADSYYYPLTASTSDPITVMKANAGTKTGTQSVYFGAKASANKPSGTYSNTVVISVVTGVVDTSTNPVTPTNPATPSSDSNVTDNLATYTSTSGFAGSTSGATVYTTKTANTTAHTNTVTTEVSSGDNTNAYPKGVSTITKKIVEGEATATTTDDASLTTALVATAGASAATGLLFLVLAKKRNNDDDEE